MPAMGVCCTAASGRPEADRLAKRLRTAARDESRADPDSGPGGGRPDEQQAPLPFGPGARRIARITLVVILLLLGLWVANGFLAPLFWAVVIAISTWPLYQRFAARRSAKRRQVLAPLLFTLAIGVVLFVPILVALQQLAQESLAIEQGLAHIRQNGIPAPGWLPDVPMIGDAAARWWNANLSNPRGIVGWIGTGTDDSERGRVVGGELLSRLFLFVVALIALFFLLRDGAWIGNRALDTADRLLGDPGERLASKMIAAVRGTVNGTVAVAVAEGIIIGAGYVLAGLPNAPLFALLTMAFAMVPLGAWAVFTAASLILLMHGGSALAAAGVFGWGALVMLIGDTFVWPALVGTAGRMPFLVALIGVFGGLQTFGLIGLILGPMILAALVTVWREWLVPPVAEPRSGKIS